MGIQRRHDRSHRPGPMDQCWHCQRARAICRTKIRFATWYEADEWVTEFNESRNYTDTVWRYYCEWCNGWHMHRTKDKVSRLGVERARRQWLRRRHGEQKMD